ncbi:uncharacterized protein BO72DRAFT_414568 [Aspergillus fijiensis CBS 313.89]|uniref:Zn(2)-C6 fungal-type domain-containing protein n=1 Tax=Aspergillus fijiensis CBS 313.89 TaxID=1448319 RepID=A0A8G1RGM1_9EURO|nr:uncharacterized protein BO72DRAFT_414568 [Aspergillus fijiensis CBS 313.89]RAK72494.1 hypothetical protein BO72DRAFT_414568 [Aspergillus fijiensis CBS 313.89]
MRDLTGHTETRHGDMLDKRRRTHDGCFACRRRRKRCDLRRPRCKGCERNALLCRWALPGTTDEQSPAETEASACTFRNPSIQKTPTGLGVASCVLKGPISSLLFKHYLQETGNAISAHRGPLNSFIQLLPCFAISYPNTVLQSLLALSGMHYRCRASSVDVDVMTFTHLGLALRSLKHGLTVFASSQFRSDNLQLLVTTLILCFLETVRVDQSGDVVHHLKAANVLFNTLITSPEQDQDNPKLLEFIKEFYVYVKNITALTGTLSSSTLFISTFSESANTIFVSQHGPGNLLGCSYELFNMVPHIEALATRGHYYLYTTPNHEADESYRQQNFQLHTYLSSWQPPEGTLPEFALSGFMYREAFLCLVERTSPSVDVRHRDIVDATRINNFLDLLNLLPLEAPVSTTSIWPIIFFGVLARNQSHQALIYTRLAHMNQMFGFGNIRSSMVFLQSCWDRQGKSSGLAELQVSDDLDLFSLMKVMNFNISLL